MSLRPCTKSKLTQLLKLHEGFSEYVYEDTEGYLTIGYGRLVDSRLSRGIDELEAEFLLRNDIEDCVKILIHKIDFWDKLSENRKIVLLNMYFNLGNRLFSFKKMLKALKKQDYVKASEEMLDSKWSEQVGQRAVDLSNMMLNDIFIVK